MSKIGKLPITIKEGTTITVSENTVHVTGPKGSLSYALPGTIGIKQEDGKVMVFEKDTTSELADASSSSVFSGLTRSLIANMVEGVNTGFEKKLELSGVGYRASLSGADLILSVGFSHPVKIKALPGIAFTVNENLITVSGIDKSLVGDIASKIRMIRPPEPYKGKGISYKGERIRRKAGKAAKAVGAAK